MDVHVADHPLIAHKLTYLRDKRTDSPTFRRLAEELMTLLAYEATREVRVEPFEIETPVAPTTGIKLSNPKPLIVPILRAGLGMLEGMVRAAARAPRSASSACSATRRRSRPVTYANRLPDDLTGRQVFVLDPMLATGGSMADAITFLFDRGADDITAVCLLAAPEGVEHLEASRPPASTSASSSSPARSTSGSTRRATSSPGSATPATASTAPSEQPRAVCRPVRAARRPTPRRARPDSARPLLPDDLTACGAIGATDLELDESLALQRMSQDAS